MAGHRLLIAAGVVLNSVEQSEDVKTGYRTIYTYTGTKAECEAQRVLERQSGAGTISMRPRGNGYHELITTYPLDIESGGPGGGGEASTDTHELEVSMAQQDVFTNPKLAAAVPTSGDREQLKFFVDNYKRGKYKTVAEVETLIGASGVASPATVLSYFRLIALKGVDHWIFYRMVYSRTRTAATPNQVKASFEGIQKLWTTAKMRAYEGLPNDWWFTLPTTTVWHKSIPKVTTNVGRTNKTQIQYNYIGSDEASTLLYDNY